MTTSRAARPSKTGSDAPPGKVLPPVATSVGPQSDDDRLIRAAVALFADRGFRAVTTRDIAREASMSPAALYVHYRTKTELLAEIIRRSHVAGLEAMEAAAAEDGSSVEKLHRIVAAQVKFNADWREHAHIGNFELNALDDDSRREITAVRRRTEKLVSDAIQAGVDSGDLVVADLSLATTAVLSLAIDVSRWFSPARRAADELALSYADLVLRMLGNASVRIGAPASRRPRTARTPSARPRRTGTKG